MGEYQLYYYIKGEKVFTGEGFAVIDAGGVGYRIQTSAYSIGELSGKSGIVTMYVQLVVREDSHEIYGFTTNEELSMFKHLVSVTGVGPKVALAILSVLSPSGVALAVITDDTKSITRAQGVGPKLAKRITLELRDKLKNEDIVSADIIAENSAYIAESDNITEAAAALTVLGYSAQDAKNVLARLDSSLSVEELVKEALKLMM